MECNRQRERATLFAASEGAASWNAAWVILRGFACVAVCGLTGSLVLAANPGRDPISLLRYVPEHTATEPEASALRDWSRRFDEYVKSVSQSPPPNLTNDLVYEAQRAGLDVRLVAAMAQVLSSFDAEKVGPTGNIGLLQISPRIQRAYGNRTNTLYMSRYNLRVGTVMLRTKLDARSGDLSLALQDYFTDIAPQPDKATVINRVLSVWRSSVPKIDGAEAIEVNSRTAQSAKAIEPTLSGGARAKVPPGTGERVAKEAMALVAFAEAGNIGARDIECRGTPFRRTDINALVEADVDPVLEAIARTDPTASTSKRSEILLMLKQMPTALDGGVGTLRRQYDQLKAEMRATYGDAGLCVALSSMIQTVMHQKRLALQDIKTALLQSESK